MQELPIVNTIEENESKIKKPNWLKVKLPTGENYRHVRELVDTHKLHTICESGNCPNMGECWGEGTATFMILGNTCTRSCGFCAVATGRPDPVDWDEPQRVAEAIYLLKVKHAVITSVDRDELKDGGSIIWYNTIKAVKMLNPDTTLETLIPDFKGEKENIQRVMEAGPEAEFFRRKGETGRLFVVFTEALEASAKPPVPAGEVARTGVDATTEAEASCCNCWAVTAVVEAVSAVTRS